jgi:hypothetical protein
MCGWRTKFLSALGAARAYAVPQESCNASAGRLTVVRNSAASMFAMTLAEDDLLRAEELVAEARRIVQEQKGRIVRLKAAGVDASSAERTLRMFEANLRRFEEHRDILKSRYKQT